ncbi:hypothetical protein F5X96DRAFT_630285 [Biscogniauxia mediterranea]|nr:hypothetical protein F5X96DRAFT_630285 [Biscogniauxia mediterranea]
MFSSTTAAFDVESTSYFFCHVSIRWQLVLPQPTGIFYSLSLFPFWRVIRFSNTILLDGRNILGHYILIYVGIYNVGTSIHHMYISLREREGGRAASSSLLRNTIRISMHRSTRPKKEN